MWPARGGGGYAADGVYHLTRRSTVRLLQELLGLRISTGSVSNLERSMSAAVEPAVDEAWAEALDLPRVCGHPV